MKPAYPVIDTDLIVNHLL